MKRGRKSNGTYKTYKTSEDNLDLVINVENADDLGMTLPI